MLQSELINPVLTMRIFGCFVVKLGVGAPLGGVVDRPPEVSELTSCTSPLLDVCHDVGLPVSEGAQKADARSFGRQGLNRRAGKSLG